VHYTCIHWTEELVDEIAADMLSGGSVASNARRLGCSPKRVRDAFHRFKGCAPSEYVARPGNDPGDALGAAKESVSGAVAVPSTESAPQDGATLPRDVQRLVNAIRSAPRGFADLCDRLDLSPRKCRSLVDRAEGLGVQVKVAHDHIGLNRAEPDAEIQSTGVDPVVGERQRVAVLSDTHYGSRYCLRDQIRDFVRYAYESGCRDVLCPGDMLDGCYHHGVFELTHSGLEAQTDDAAENLPQHDGLRYHWITGNHDFTFTGKTGVGVGSYVIGRFAEHGRSDVQFYGDHGAYLKIAGAVVHLWHPRGSNATYALSYPLQKQLERYARVKPQILLAGHWHRYTWVTQRGVHALGCPCFQGGQSAFGRSLGGNPTIGGLLLSWQATGTGTIRRFGVECCMYYEDERPVEVRNAVDGKAIPPTVSRPVAVPDTRWQSCTA